MKLHDSPWSRAALSPETRARIERSLPAAAHMSLLAAGPRGPFTAIVAAPVGGVMAEVARVTRGSAEEAAAAALAWQEVTA